MEGAAKTLYRVWFQERMKNTGHFYNLPHHRAEAPRQQLCSGSREQPLYIGEGGYRVPGGHF